MAIFGSPLNAASLARQIRALLHRLDFLCRAGCIAVSGLLAQVVQPMPNTLLPCT
jgi:hypothetical protein